MNNSNLQLPTAEEFQRLANEKWGDDPRIESVEVLPDSDGSLPSICLAIAICCILVMIAWVLLPIVGAWPVQIPILWDIAS